MTSVSARRILIITGIFPPDIGGPATYVPQMATALAERGHSITVLTLSDEKIPLSSSRAFWSRKFGITEEGRSSGSPSPREARAVTPAPAAQEHPSRSPSPPLGERDGVRGDYPFAVVRLPRQAFKPWRWLLTMLTILHLGRRADVLFVNGLALEAMLANVVLRKPLVQKIVGDVAWERATNWGWVHDSFEEFQKQSYGLQLQALKAIRAWCSRQADRVIVPSHYLAGWVQAWGVRSDKIAVIYNAIALPSPSTGEGQGGGERQAPTTVSLPISTPVNVVTVGRLVPLKQVDKIIQAIAHLDGVGLVIIGDGAERGALENLARSLGLTERVHFAGQRGHAETLALMAACDLFVLNSTHEGFPHVVLEAMSVGLPVVATAVGGTPELVQDGVNGRLISPDARAMLAEMLLKLTASPQERQQWAAGARCTASCFTLPALVSQTEALLQSTAQAGRNGV
jgi:glycosyltransferase involved in cell wall biosynthesis